MTEKPECGSLRAGDLDGFVNRWLEVFLADKPWIRGAYRVGSTAELPSDARIDSCSDIDVMLVTDGCEKREKPGKIPVSGQVIEATYLPWDEIGDAERSLANYHIAHGLHLRRVLFDRDGSLTALCESVAKEFSKPERIRARVKGVIEKIEAGLSGFPEAGKPYARLTSLAFNAGIMAHAVLVAAQKNPTVRTRYKAVRDVLAPIGEEQAHEELLAVAGCADITPSEARGFVNRMAELFDEVSPVRRTRFFFTSDLEPEMRPSAVDDMLEMIEGVLARECMFWVVATYCRLLQQAEADAPDIYARYLPGLEELSRRLGVGTPEGERARIDAIRSALPGVSALADRIVERA